MEIEGDYTTGDCSPSLWHDEETASVHTTTVKYPIVWKNTTQKLTITTLAYCNNNLKLFKMC